MLRIISLAIAFVAISSHADTVYKCQDGDHIVFSQMPCKTDNNVNEQLDYPKVQNSFSSKSNQRNSVQKNTNPATYLLSKKKERSLAKIKTLKRKLNDEVEKIKANGLTAGVNRAGAGYLKLLNDELIAVSNKYQKSIDKEQQTLDRIEQEINKVDTGSKSEPWRCIAGSV
jgi:flagellar biosynthesis/type III secretory pathway protein FliH